MTTLLAVGDIHLGRLPAAMPRNWRERVAELGPAAAWQRTVAAAIDGEVDGVLLAGDVVESRRDLLVGYRDLKAGIDQLARAGIPVIAVAGNHDTEVLPRLAGEIEQLTLLGAGGQWQTVPLAGARILGWSFPAAHVTRDPLATLPETSGDGALIGLLHCDRDRPDSRYAPVSSQSLAQAKVDAWLLGHIHQPDELGGDRPVGYLGSLSALRASDTGARGPWRIVIGDDRRVRATQLALAPLRFEQVSLDAGELDEPSRLHARILAAARELAESLAGDSVPPELVGLRIELAGTHQRPDELQRAADELLAEDADWRERDIGFFIQRIDLDTTPVPDLEALAGRDDPPGLLAQRLLALDRPESEPARRLIRRARREMQSVAQAREFQPLASSPDDAGVIDYLRRAGRRALAKLLEQEPSR